MALKEVAFEIPESLNASVPPERRGVRRDYVQLMVLDKLTGETEHCKFYELTRFLQKGDLLVLNASRTVPALLTASWVKEGKTMSPHVEVRLAHRLNEWEWEALVVATGVEIGDVLIISASLQARVVRKARDP